MGWIQLAVLAFQLLIKFFDLWREKDLEKKKKQTEALQSGVRAIADKDVSRLNAAIRDINRLR